MDDDQQFCLRWNNHQSTLVAVFDTLLEKGMHVDCTLAAEGQTLKAHKVVLSACSPYFESVLSQQYDKHPIIILKDVKYAELRAMMDYMYRGEVNISQDQLAALLKAAESLQIKGLSDNKPSRPPSRPAPPPPPPVALAAHAPPAHPPRAISPSPQVRDGSIDSREGSVSPSRRRKKARRMSSEVPIVEPASVAAPVSLPAATTTAAPQGNGRGESPRCKEESSRDNLDDLTYDEDADDPHALVAHHPPTHNDVVRNFQWHMERSQDEMNSSDNVRESQEGGLGSALLSLLSLQRAPPQLLQALAAPSLPTLAGKRDSDDEYDDTDDIVLPEDAESYGLPPALSLLPAGTAAGAGSQTAAELKLKREEEASRQFECRHCGKKYRWKSTLRRHENVECGGKAPAHQCPYCSYRAKQRGNLGVHIRKHHNQEWYVYATSKVRRNKKTSI